MHPVSVRRRQLCVLKVFQIEVNDSVIEESPYLEGLVVLQSDGDTSDTLNEGKW